MKSKQVDEQVIQKVYQVLDKLEQRIATLEKVLQSHAKVIGEIRDKDDLEDMPEEVLVKTWEDKNDQYIIFSWNLCNWNFSLFRNERNRGNMTKYEIAAILFVIFFMFAMFWIAGIR